MIKIHKLFQSKSIIWLALVSIIGLSILMSKASGSVQESDDERSYCPFGICMAININSIKMIDELIPTHLLDYIAYCIIPPKPFLKGKSLSGELFEGAQYNVLYSKETGVCAVSLYGPIKKEKLAEFYRKAEEYLGIGLDEFNYIGDEQQVAYSLKGDKLPKDMKDIVEIAIFEINYKLALPPGQAVAFDFWFKNRDECISYQPEIDKFIFRPKN